MLSLARNERGIRLLSAAIILLPLVTLICVNSHSSLMTMAAIFVYFAFAAGSFIAFLFERAEEELEDGHDSHNE